MVDSWCSVDRIVPERMSQVWRWSEVGNLKRRSLNTRLSSGTSANTSCRSRNAPSRMIRSDLFWYGNNLKMNPTYREKNLLDYLFGGFRSTLKACYGSWPSCINSSTHVCVYIFVHIRHTQRVNSSTQVCVYIFTLYIYSHTYVYISVGTYIYIVAHTLTTQICNSSQRVLWPPKNGEIALWPNTRVVKCEYCVSQKWNEAKDKVQWYNFLLTFIF